MAKLTKAIYDALAPDDQERVRDGLREAACYIAHAWDSLRDVEIACGDHDVEVETDEIESLAGDTTEPEDALSLSDEDLLNGFFGEAA